MKLFFHLLLAVVLVGPLVYGLCSWAIDIERWKDQRRRSG